MRLLIVGPLEGYISAAGKIAMARGAKVAHVDDVEQALVALRAGQGADLVLWTSSSTSRSWSRPAAGAHRVPVVACGIGADAGAAVRAIKAGAKEYLPLPPDAELIAAVLQAVAQESHALLYRDPAMESLVRLAEQVAPSRSERPHHRRKRHRQGSAGPLHPSQEPPRQAELHLGQLRGDPGEPARMRAVRPREGRLHRRRRAPHRQVRGGQRRHAAARRNQRDGPAAAGQAAARHPGTRDRPRRRHAAGQGRHPPHRHLQPRPRRRRCARASSARTSISASTSSRCASRALRERPRDIALLAEHFAKKYAEVNGAAGTAAVAGGARDADRATPGAAMCASWRTPCTAPCCWPRRRDRARSHRCCSPLQARDGDDAVAAWTPAARQGMVGRTVADVERDLILDTLSTASATAPMPPTSSASRSARCATSCSTTARKGSPCRFPASRSARTA